MIDSSSIGNTIGPDVSCQDEILEASITATIHTAAWRLTTFKRRPNDWYKISNDVRGM